MSTERFTTKLFLPAQAAAETEATILTWHVAEGDAFEKGQSLAEVESAKSTFEFEAPCSGTVTQLLCPQGETIAFEDPVIEVETDDPSMKEEVRPGAEAEVEAPQMRVPHAHEPAVVADGEVSILGIGGYVPQRVVSNSELLADFPDMTDDYLFRVTGIRQRNWAADEKPSDMAYAAATGAIEKSGIDTKEIDAIVVATTTPDVFMPSTACILQKKLGLFGIPAFDLNAACSGWLYAIAVARGLTLSGVGENILVVGVDLQSQLLDKKDKVTYFLFGDGAGATVVSSKRPGHRIRGSVLLADAQGLRMARREHPGYRNIQGEECDPWIRLDGHALFRFATESFSSIIKDTMHQSGWETPDVRWVVPHQANGRILRAAAKRSGIPFERFYLNIDHMGNTSSASIPLAMLEIEKGLQSGDKLVLCSVGAGITAAALSLEW